MKWKQPPIIKIYEALGCLADGRLRFEEGEVRVYSSTGNKYYTVKYDSDGNAIMSNDNGAYWRGFLGYPAIAYLMHTGIIDFNETYSRALAGIEWKEINQKFNNDFEKTVAYCHAMIAEQGHHMQDFLDEIGRIEKQIADLQLDALGSPVLPPEGY